MVERLTQEGTVNCINPQYMGVCAKCFKYDKCLAVKVVNKERNRKRKRRKEMLKPSQ